MIRYDGIGADPSGLHTEERFLEIMDANNNNYSPSILPCK